MREGSFNTIHDPYARVCVPNKVKNMNLKLFDSILRVNETTFINQHDSCECKCGLNETVCNSKQKWNPDECWCDCDCKELYDWGACQKDYMWNPSIS